MLREIKEHKEAIRLQIASLGNGIEKGRKMPIGTVSRGFKKIAEGKWVPVKKDVQKSTKKEMPDDIKSQNKESLNREWNEIKKYGNLYSGHYKKVFSGKNKNILTVTVFLNNPKYKKIKDYAKKMGFDVWETTRVQTFGRGSAYGDETPAIVIKKDLNRLKNK